MKRTIFLIFLWVLLITCASLPDVRVAPVFGHPYVFADRIVFTSVDGTQLIAIDKKGELQWELAFPDRIYLQRWGEELAIQTGRDVYKIGITNGEKTELFVMPENEILMDFGSNLLVAADGRFDHNHLRILNPIDFSTTWESSSIESIVAVTSSTVVAVTAERIYENENTSFHLENGALRGFDRKSGKRRWSFPLDNPYLSAPVQAGDFLAIIERLRTFTEFSRRLLILDPDTGAVLFKQQGAYTDLWPLENSLGVFENSDGATKAEFYVCGLPECVKTAAISLTAKEILKGRLYGDYIITAGIYDAACFDRATGKRLWQKGQLEWSEPFDDTMIITDFSAKEQSARIVAVDLETGREHVLFSRTITDHDKANFFPW